MEDDIRYLKYNTLIDVLMDRSINNDIGVTFIHENTEEFLSYQKLYSHSLKILKVLQNMGLVPHDEIVFQIEDAKEFLLMFWACILGGIIPIPVAVRNNHEHKLKVFNIWKILQNPYFVSSNDIFSKLDDFADQNNLSGIMDEIKSKKIIFSEIVDKEQWDGEVYNADPEEIAYIQFSSGTTGDPKGVVLTHENLLTNIKGIIQGSKIDKNTISLSWMPLTHDMGLIGFHLSTMTTCMQQFIMSPILFIIQPMLWLRKVSEHRVGAIGAPNFAYKHVLNSFKPELAENLDLSSIKLILNGAEPISADLCYEFLDEFSKYGLSRNAMFPVYGLAEASVAVSFPPVEEDIVEVNLDRFSLEVGKPVVYVEKDDVKKITFIDVGSALMGTQIRIADNDNNVVPEHVIGNIQIKGKNVTAGYYKNKKATEEVFTDDGWLNTGDLGFMRNERLVITGRAKDIIFINGQNFYSHDIEREVENEDIKGIGMGKLVAVGVYDDRVQYDKIVIFVHAKDVNLKEFMTTAFELRRAVRLKIGLEVNHVIPVPSIPRTTSGKVQRSKLRDNFLKGKYDDLIREMYVLAPDFNKDIHSNNDDNRPEIPRLHPLIGSNTSTLIEQRFTSRLTGEEFFLSDHRVIGRKVFPGAAYIEMARIAGEISAEMKVQRIKRVVWARPFISTDTMQEIHISLYSKNDSVDYRVNSYENNEKVMHSQGKIIFSDNDEKWGLAYHIDINKIKERCPNFIKGEECYKIFQLKGLEYGASFQSIEELNYNNDEAISKLHLPVHLREKCNEFLLHPALLDGAFQTVMGLMMDSDANTLYLPFALGEMEIFNSLPEICYTYVVPVKSDNESSSRIRRFNIDIADEEGNVLVIMKDFSLGELRGTAENQPSKKAESSAYTEEFQMKIEEDIIQLCADILRIKISDLDVATELSEFGMDSINMIKMLNRIEGMYNIVLDPNALVEHRTIRSFVKYLIDQKLIKDESESIVQKDFFTPVYTEDSQAPIEKIDIANQGNRFFKNHKLHRTSSEKKIEKIAVIGMACRFPRSNSLEEFWDNLKNGRDLIVEVPEERWSIDDFYSADKEDHNKTYSKWGGFIHGIEFFDAGYFGISEQDAVVLDPQQRILLELTQELLDRAGYRKEDISEKRVGVIIGGGESYYLISNMDKVPHESMKHMLVNSISNMMAARISDFYNLKGFSQTIDTACSSSLVSIHHACQSIRSGECEMVIAGGIELLLNPTSSIGFSRAEVLSEDGKSYIFDERAHGFVLGEGAGLVLLKSYDAALEDGDQILGVILGSAINNDGRTMGVTVPSMEGQKEVIEAALNSSKITPESIGYLEAHGTGTLLGDPIEIKAATQVYQKYTKDLQYCAVGSVKSNIGHLLRAAGIASFIKVILAVQNEVIPPTLHCTRPHPRFSFQNSPFYPITELRKWLPLHGHVRAAISSFGFGGTNCHMIIEKFSAGDSSNYILKRRELPITGFRRKRYWLGKEIVDEINEKTIFDRDYNLKLLEKLEQGHLNSDQVLELMNIG